MPERVVMHKRVAHHRSIYEACMLIKRQRINVLLLRVWFGSLSCSLHMLLQIRLRSVLKEVILAYALVLRFRGNGWELIGYISGWGQCALLQLGLELTQKWFSLRCTISVAPQLLLRLALGDVEVMEQRVFQRVFQLFLGRRGWPVLLVPDRLACVGVNRNGWLEFFGWDVLVKLHFIYERAAVITELVFGMLCRHGVPFCRFASWKKEHGLLDKLRVLGAWLSYL